MTVVINKAFTIWGDDIPIPALEAIDLAASLNAIRRLLLSPPASVDPICQEQLEPFTEMDPTLALCDPASFLDPEHTVQSIDCRDAFPTTLRRCN
jgi:hypothetical protein